MKRIVSASLLVVLIAAYSARADCIVAGYDLSSIPTASLAIQQSYQGKLNNYNWVVNLCGVVNQPPSGANTCKDTSGNPLPGYVSEYSTTACETTWSANKGATAGTNSLVMNLGQTAASNNPTWTATVTLNCAGTDPALVSTGPVMVTGTGALNFAFTFTTSAVCGAGPPPPPGPTPVPPTPVPGTPTTPTPPATPVPNPNPNPVPAPPEESAACGGGCAFTIIVFVGGFVYVVVTVLWYYFRQGKRGLELLPHPEFWKEFGACVKDGVIFSVQKIRALACKSGPYADSGYQQV